MMVKVEVLHRHGRPGDTPVWQSAAMEVGEAEHYVPSDDLMQELHDCLAEQAQRVVEGNACEVTVTFQPAV
jgi:hypothetical protein